MRTKKQCLRPLCKIAVKKKSHLIYISIKQKVYTGIKYLPVVTPPPHSWKLSLVFKGQEVMFLVQKPQSRKQTLISKACLVAWNNRRVDNNYWLRPIVCRKASQNWNEKLDFLCLKWKKNTVKTQCHVWKKGVVCS